MDNVTFSGTVLAMIRQQLDYVALLNQNDSIQSKEHPAIESSYLYITLPHVHCGNLCFEILGNI